jgi:gluconolactonase
MKKTKLSLLLTLMVIVTLSAPTIDEADATPRLDSSAAGADKVENFMLKVERLDPAVDRIIPTGASLERVATGFTWLEGPVWVNGSLFFADIPSNSIHKWTPGAGVSTFLQPSGYKGTTPFGGSEPGSNGMTLDSRGRLTVAGHAQRDVYRLESLSPGAPITILADSFQGKRMAHALEQKAGAEPARGELQLLVSDLPRPNGIAFSPDEKYLYVDDSERKVWMRYRVQADSTLTEAKLFYDASSDKRPGAPDGMKVDREGNIYSSGPGGVWIFSPEGKPLAKILMPEKVANLAWGGTDHRMLYITASSSLYRVHLKIEGAPLVRGR